MTYKRWRSEVYLAQMKAISDDDLRTKIRTTATLLAGNPWMAPSVSLYESMRSISVKGMATLTYEICPKAVLKLWDVKIEEELDDAGKP